MSLPVLYSFRRCPYAMRARMALDVADIKVEHREVLLRNKPAAMLEASPKGTVPVLVLPNGQVIDESLDVMLWALRQSDPQGWLDEPEAQAASINAFLDAFKDHLDRYKYASRYDNSVDRGSVDHEQREKAKQALLDFTASLEQHPFLGGVKPDLTDIATFPFVRQFAAVEPNWWQAEAPTALQAWLAHFLDSDRFKCIMKKHPLWVSPKG